MVALGAAQGAQPEASSTLPVRVVHVSPEGAVSAWSDAEVVLESWTRPPGPSGDKVLGACWTGRTDAQGFVAFGGLQPLASGEYVPTVVRDGVVFRGPAVGKDASFGPIDVRVYDVTPAQASLSLTLHVDLSVRDGFIIVDSTAIVQTASRRAVVLGAENDGLRLPIALPALYGAAMPWGLLPPETSRRHMALRATPAHGRFAFVRGGLFYQGAIIPGQPSSLQWRYALPLSAERMDLALSSPIEMTSLAVSTTWSNRVAPRVVPDRPHQLHQRLRGEEVQRFARIDDPPAPGESFLLRVGRLPMPLVVQAHAAVVGAAFLFGLFLLALIAWRPRRD